MRWCLALVAVLCLATAGCDLMVHGSSGHPDGPGNSENAPGHNKH